MTQFRIQLQHSNDVKEWLRDDDFKRAEEFVRLLVKLCQVDKAQLKKLQNVNWQQGITLELPTEFYLKRKNGKKDIELYYNDMLIASNIENSNTHIALESLKRVLRENGIAQESIDTVSQEMAKRARITEEVRLAKARMAEEETLALEEETKKRQALSQEQSSYTLTAEVLSALPNNNRVNRDNILPAAGVASILEWKSSCLERAGDEKSTRSLSTVGLLSHGPDSPKQSMQKKDENDEEDSLSVHSDESYDDCDVAFKK